jgi:hypothetical protein
MTNGEAREPKAALPGEMTEEELRRLIRGALSSEERPPGDVLRGVQQKIRKRSHGKFYDEGWSTAEHPPIYTYLLTSTLMLVVLFVVYAVLMPTAGEPLPVSNEPAPVQIIPSRR